MGERMSFPPIDNYKQIRELVSYVHSNRHDYIPYIHLGKAFLSNGFVDNAIEAFNKSIYLNKKNPETKNYLLQAIKIKNDRTDKLLHLKKISVFTVEKFIGMGWEGAVYKVFDHKNNKYIIKLFHPPFVKLINYEGLGGIYHKTVRSRARELIKLSWIDDTRDNPIYTIDLLWKDSDIIGVKYQYQHLMMLDKRSIYKNHTGNFLLKNFFNIQAYLLRNKKSCLYDSSVKNFMVSIDGDLHYVDYGTSIIPVDDFRCCEEHWETVALIKLLFAIFNPRNANSLEMNGLEAIFRKKTGLIESMEESKIVKEIVNLVDSGRFEFFLDYSFYQYLHHHISGSIRIMPLIKILIKDLKNYSLNPDTIYQS